MNARCYIGNRLEDESAQHDAECAQCRAASEPPTIVGEVSKVWRVEREQLIDGPILCQRFEIMIEHNRKRGYRLQSWQLRQVMTQPGEMTETIVAVFTRAES